MSIYLDISAALDSNLNDMASLPPVAWENKEFDPVVGTLYLRPTVLFGDTNQSTLGDSGEDVNEGIYQIDVFAEAGDGKNAAITMADTVSDQFKRGTILNYNNRVVRVVSAQRRPATVDDGWYIIPVEIVYRSYTTPRT